jgi:hypothetical protein
MLKREELMAMFESAGAIRHGHFELSSGLHSGMYVQCALVLQYPRFAEKLGQNLASLFGDLELDAVVSPAMGGLIIGHEVARALPEGKSYGDGPVGSGVPAIFVERDASGTMTAAWTFLAAGRTARAVCRRCGRLEDETRGYARGGDAGRGAAWWPREALIDHAVAERSSWEFRRGIADLAIKELCGERLSFVRGGVLPLSLAAGLCARAGMAAAAARVRGRVLAAENLLRLLELSAG